MRRCTRSPQENVGPNRLRGEAERPRSKTKRKVLIMLHRQGGGGGRSGKCCAVLASQMASWSLTGVCCSLSRPQAGTNNRYYIRKAKMRETANVASNVCPQVVCCARFLPGLLIDYFEGTIPTLRHRQGPSASNPFDSKK